MDVQADRGRLLQALKDPLDASAAQFTRAWDRETGVNARAGRWKKRAGAISLRLEAHGNRLAMTVEDDGRGIDVARVAQAAVAKRVVSEAALAAMSAREQARLIFHPGVSTSRAVTELSGRGMGLNIVADAVGRLQGTVDVQPSPKGGTTFVVSVPLAVSSHRLVLVKCGGQKYALAAHAIEGLHRIKLDAIASLEGRPAVSVHGAFLPLASLADVLLSRDAGVETELVTVPVAVLKTGERRVAFAVDAFVCEMEGVIKDLSPLVTKSGKFAGAILLGDGSVVLVLDASELIEAVLAFGSKAAWLKTSAPALGEAHADDSRRGRFGDHAHAGEEHSGGARLSGARGGGWRRSADAVAARSRSIWSCPMRRCRGWDGFGLLQEMKKDAQLAKTPILLVTSLEKREDKERGLALGADGYIVKRKFDQKVLLDTVRQML